MKIAIIGSRGYPYIYSGYETFVKELSERLVLYGIAVTVYCHRNLFTNRPRNLNGIELVYIPTIEKKSISQFLHSFQSILHASLNKNDIILVVNSSNGPFGLITRFFNKKTIINVDGLEWLRPKWKGIGAKYFYWASKMATYFYDVIVNDSFAMEQIYLEHFQAKSVVIAYGANIRYSQSSNFLKKWRLNIQDYYLIVGRLIPDNNAQYIIEEFLKSESSKKLVIVGDVPYKDEYAIKIKGLKDNRLLFTGYVKDQTELAELYHNCYAYIHGHEFGGTNPTMLKALAYGCAILALDTVFTREMLLNGKFGVFFNKEKDSLMSLIGSIEKNPSTLVNFRKHARERIIENYTWEKVTKQYIELFNKILYQYSVKNLSS